MGKRAEGKAAVKVGIGWGLLAMVLSPLFRAIRRGREDDQPQSTNGEPGYLDPRSTPPSMRNRAEVRDARVHGTPQPTHRPALVERLRALVKWNDLLSDDETDEDYDSNGMVRFNRSHVLLEKCRGRFGRIFEKAAALELSIEGAGSLNSWVADPLAETQVAIRELEEVLLRLCLDSLGLSEADYGQRAIRYGRTAAEQFELDRRTYSTADSPYQALADGIVASMRESAGRERPVAHSGIEIEAETGVAPTADYASLTDRLPCALRVRDLVGWYFEKNEQEDWEFTERRIHEGSSRANAILEQFNNQMIALLGGMSALGAHATSIGGAGALGRAVAGVDGIMQELERELVAMFVQRLGLSLKGYECRADFNGLTCVEQFERDCASYGTPDAIRQIISPERTTS